MKTGSLVALAAAAVLGMQDAKNRPVPPDVGDPAPSIRLNDESGKVVSLGGKEADGWMVRARHHMAQAFLHVVERYAMFVASYLRS